MTLTTLDPTKDPLDPLFIFPGKEVGRIDFARADALLSRALVENGIDHVYVKEQYGGNCKNFHEGVPACIIGHALSYLGLKATDVPEASIASVWQDLMLDIDADALDLWKFTQAKQDNGAPWGEAVEFGHSVVERRRGEKRYESSSVGPCPCNDSECKRVVDGRTYDHEYDTFASSDGGAVAS